MIHVQDLLTVRKLRSLKGRFRKKKSDPRISLEIAFSFLKEDGTNGKMIRFAFKFFQNRKLYVTAQLPKDGSMAHNN